MNTLELKPGDKIGIFYHDDRRGAKARISEVKKVSPTGQVTLISGKRYASNRKEMGIDAIDATYLCTVEKATAVMQKAEELKKQREEERKAYLASPEGRRNTA